LGEIITNEELIRREEEREKATQLGSQHTSYIMTLDKFVLQNPYVFNGEEPYAVDGEKFSGPTRFINHSCSPNLRQFSVCYHHRDLKVFNVCFFAVKDLAPDTELTFDYRDDQETEEQDEEEGTAEFECRCGARKCRGKLWK
jgi:[histone H3]-lysine9 N-trimethyltransferase SUV39H